MKNIRVMDRKYDVTGSDDPWWLDKVHCPRDIPASDIKRTVTVVVVDTGTGPSDFPFPNIVPGYNAITGGGDTRDRNGHGRMLSHLIGSPNIGVNPYATVLPVKVRNTLMDDPEIVSRGVIWAVDHGADIRTVNGTEIRVLNVEKAILPAKKGGRSRRGGCSCFSKEIAEYGKSSMKSTFRIGLIVPPSIRRPPCRLPSGHPSANRSSEFLHNGYVLILDQ